jgi:hypothetical protein
MPSIPRHTIGHLNKIHVRPRSSVPFAMHPEAIDDSEESSDDEVFRHPEQFRGRHDSVPILRHVPMPRPVSSNPMLANPMVVNTPIVMAGNPNVANPNVMPINPMAAMPGNRMGMAGRRQGSMSMAPGHVQGIPQQSQVAPMDIVTRPYSYLTYYRPGARYPSIANDLQILVNPKNSNLKQIIDVLVQRSPYELDALRYEFRVMTGGQDLQLVLNSLTKEDDCIKSVVAGLTLGPVAFDLWLLDGVLFPLLLVTND